MHAREHITAEQCLYLVSLLTTNYGQSTPLGQRVTNVVNNREIWIVPMLNPDGAMFDISGAAFHGWRKNRQVNPGSTKIGIDLNRNWGYKWACCGGSGPNPKSARYRGRYPFEAVENQVLRDFILSRRVGGVQQISEVLNVHSYGDHVLYPYGYTKEDVPPDMTADDHATFVALAKKMASLNGYKAMQGSQMYIYDGDFIDWAYGDQRIFAFTWEMYPPWGCGCGGFHPPDTVIARETSRNAEAALYLLEQADCPYREAGLGATHCS
jgi:carboxypeptidase T